MRVRVLFFGMLKDIVGKPEHSLELAEGSRLDTVFEHYAGLYPRLHDLRSSIVLARNQQFSSASAELADGDEVALLPPVSGGSASYTHTIHDEEAGHFFALTRDPIDVAGLERSLLRGEDGAIVSFQGVARNNTKGRATRRLDYECYEPMAIQVMAGLGREIAGAHPISRIAMVHRLGLLEIGETSVAVVVTAPHRKPAFEAALEGINRLKRTVPIWKKEHFADGEIWVEGEWDTALPGKR